MTFECVLTAIRATTAEARKIQTGGKVLLPDSLMHTLLLAGVRYPILFRIAREYQTCEETSQKKSKFLYCGVLEFTAQDNTVILPDWMAEFLDMEDFCTARIENVSLPLGSYVRIRPLEDSFLCLHNPKAVLEYNLANFSALTKGATLQLYHNNRTYHIMICEVRARHGETQIDPDGVCIIDVDVVLDIENPSFDGIESRATETSKLNYQREMKQEDDFESSKNDQEFIPFTGHGRSLSESTSSSIKKNGGIVTKSPKGSDNIFVPFGCFGRSLKE